MNVQGYQKLTLLDFPGRLACTVFTGGCNLRCPFCHNGGLVRTPLANSGLEAEVLTYLKGRRGLLDGVCITGGEPLLQPDLERFVREVKEMGYLVKLDTNGSLPHKLEALLSTGLLDYVAMDVKSALADYETAVGTAVDAAAFARSIALIKASGIAHEFRTTAVKGIHTAAHFEAIGRLLGDEPYFIQQFVDSGDLLGTGCAAFTPEESRELLAAARIYIPRAALRGID